LRGDGTSQDKPGNSNLKEFVIDISKFNKTPSTYRDNIKYEQIVRVKCIKEISNRNGLMLNVRAYQEGCKSGDDGSIVGALKVCPNDRQHRKTVKIAFVEVKTNIKKARKHKIARLEDYGSATLDCLFIGLHQALIVPDIVNREGLNEPRYTLDLTNVPMFRHPSTRPKGDTSSPSDWGKYILRTSSGVGIDLYGEGFGETLVDEFKRQNPGQAEGRMLIFCFRERTNDAAAFSDWRPVLEWREEDDEVVKTYPSGRFERVVEKHYEYVLTGIPNVYLFYGMNPGTMVHEVMHSLSLQHTHRDWIAPNIPEDSLSPKISRYIFPKNSTTNIMSYSDYSNTTWHWQWEIMQDFLTKIQDKKGG
jgi:hypothetical protein